MKNLRLEQFEKILSEKPESRAFAPLTEIHRKNGQLEKALEISLRGVELNPAYHGGRVALARVLIDLNQLSEAKTQLDQVVSNEPENIMALRLLGKTSIQLKDFHTAMRVYTQLKALQPDDLKSEKILEGLKSKGVTANLDSTPELIKPEHSPTPAGLEKKIAFIDALLDQSKYKKAEAMINEALKTYASNPDLNKRLNYISGLNKPSSQLKKTSALTPYATQMKKIKILNLALNKISKRLNHDSNFRF